MFTLGVSFLFPLGLQHAFRALGCELGLAGI